MNKEMRSSAPWATRWGYIFCIYIFMFSCNFLVSKVTRSKTPRFHQNIFFLKNYQRFLNFVKFTFSQNSWCTF